MWTVLSYVVVLISYVSLQIIILFKCISIDNKRNFLLKTTVIYTIAYVTLSFWLSYHLGYTDDTMFKTISVINYTVNIFFMLVIISVGSDEFLPRNFLLLTFYFDILSIFPLPHDIITNLIVLHMNNHHDLDVSLSIYHVNSSVDMVTYIPWLTMPLVIYIIYRLLNKRLLFLIRKIPNILCTVIFLAVFFVYIIRFIVILNVASANFIDNYYGSNSYFLFQSLTVVCIVFTVLLFMMTVQKHIIKKIISLETQFQLNYYNNVTDIYTEIRRLKHDLANHLTAVKYSGNNYMNSLLDTCNSICERAINQMKWQDIDIDMISPKEKYEIYQLVIFIVNYFNASSDSVNITKYYEDNKTIICITISADKVRHTDIIYLKISSIYSLIKMLIAQYNGNIELNKKGTTTCCLTMKL